MQFHHGVQKGILKKIIVVLQLLFFSISVMPKAYFHDVFAHHKAVLSCKLLHKSSAVNTQGTHCSMQESVQTFFITGGPCSACILMHRILLMLLTRSHLNWLKYTDVTQPTGRQGILNMGRNYSLN